MPIAIHTIYYIAVKMIARNSAFSLGSEGGGLSARLMYTSCFDFYYNYKKIKWLPNPNLKLPQTLGEISVLEFSIAFFS